MLRRITIFKIIAKAMIVAIFAGALFWSVGLYKFYYMIPVSASDNTEKTDAIIVLTGGQERIAEAIRLLNQNLAPKMLISGVAKTTPMEKLLEKQDLSADDLKKIDASKIDVGRQAINTVGNARETAEWVEQNHVQSIRLVTSSYHMPRALLEFHKYVPGVTIIPHPVFPADFHRDDWRHSEFTRNLILVEYTKYLLASIE